jgi:hypothetical protein
MSIAGISSSSLFQPTALQSFFVQRRLDIQQLGQALHSGDLATAQAAYTTLNALQRSVPAQNASGQSGTSAGPFLDKKVAHDFAAVGQALQSGDVAGAQQAFATLQQDIQGTGRGHRQGGGTPFPNSAPEIVVNLIGNGLVPTPPIATPVTDNSGSTTLVSGNPGGSGALAPITSSIGSPAAAITSSTGSAVPATTSTATSSVASATPEIILNLSGGASAGVPELILNLGNSSNNGPAGPELTLNFSNGTGNGSANPEITLNFNNGGGNGSSAPELVLNLGTTGSAEIAFNFGNSNGQSQSGGIQVDIVA